jgi:UDP-GlcNAc:undecaprenyl-phosphate GlcNAc-1-phosphate transferase
MQEVRLTSQCLIPLLAQSTQPVAVAARAADSAAVTPVTPTSLVAAIENLISPHMGVFFIAFVVAYITTPLMRYLAVKNGIVDWPDLRRKAHIEPIAYLGGVAIFLGWLLAICYSFFPPLGSGLKCGVAVPPHVIIGAGVIALIGLLDDVYGLSPRVKIGGQLVAAAALSSLHLGPGIATDFLGLVGLSDFAATPTGIWVAYALGAFLIAAFVIGGCNAVNLLDGLDGLASGTVAIAMLGFMLIAAFVAAGDLGDLTYDPVRIVICLATLGAILGFLPYNFNPANIFMGDAGSLLLGYLCVATILLFGQVRGQSLLYITACLIVFAVPITDTSLAIFRRKMRGQPIFSPDNQHIHHLLRRSGFSVRNSVFIIWSLAALFAVLGTTMVWVEFRWRYILAVFFVVFGFVFATAYKIGHRQITLSRLREQGATADSIIAPVNQSGSPEAPMSVEAVSTTIPTAVSAASDAAGSTAGGGAAPTAPGSRPSFTT